MGPQVLEPTWAILLLKHRGIFIVLEVKSQGCVPFDSGNIEYDTPAQKLGCINAFVNKKLINSQLKKEIEVLLGANLRIITGRQSLRKLSETCPGEVRRRSTMYMI